MMLCPDCMKDLSQKVCAKCEANFKKHIKFVAGPIPPVKTELAFLDIEKYEAIAAAAQPDGFYWTSWDSWDSDEWQGQTNSPVLRGSREEAECKFLAGILLSKMKTTCDIVIPEHDEWVGLNLLERDDELRQFTGNP